MSSELTPEVKPPLNRPAAFDRTGKTGTKLTKRNRLFCQYFTDIKSADTFGNASAAARSAGYPHKSAGVHAVRLLKKDCVCVEIARLEKELTTKVNISRAQYLNILFLNANECNNQKAVKARFIEMIGRVLGYLEPEERANQISLFQAIDGKITQSLEKMPTKAIEAIVI